MEQNKHNGQSHGCSDLLFGCMDFRLRPAIDEFLTPYISNGGCDEIRFPGVAKALLDDQTGPMALGAIRIGVEKHGVQRVMLVNHRDCGAYGGTAAFHSPEVERAEHEGDLRRAAQLLHKEFPDLTVDLYFAETHNNGKTFVVEPLREGISVR